VRRLVSEGTRLRLPWAQRVAWLDAHPERILDLLEMLKDDRASVVRRSVANNLNDLGKIRPELLVRTCEAWLADASSERREMVAHALRGAMKRGQPEALRLLGFGKKAAISIEDVRFEPQRVPIGGRVTIGLILRSRSRAVQNLRVDLAVHFVKASGRASPKVFTLARATLAPRQKLPLRRTVSLAIHTTRKPHAGRHAVDIIVNGVTTRIGSFQVV